MGSTRKIVLPRFFDAHVHLRFGAMLRLVIVYTMRACARALVMPNVPPTLTAIDVIGYRSEILAAAHGYDDRDRFEPLMSVYLTEDTTPQVLRAARGAGAVAAKFYPKGATTGSELGATNLREFYGLFEEMRDLGMMLCLHGEVPGDDIPHAEREEKFLPDLFDVARAFPKLRIMLEHVSTAAGVEAVLSLPDNVGATVTLHHLLLTRDDVGTPGAPGFRPHHFCAPIAKSEVDRQRLLRAVLEENHGGKFVYGTDSAPHDENAKIAECKAGCFTAPIAPQKTVQIFEEAGRRDMLPYFTSYFASDRYHLSRITDTVTFENVPYTVRPVVRGNLVVVPPFEGEVIPWRIAA